MFYIYCEEEKKSNSEQPFYCHSSQLTRKQVKIICRWIRHRAALEIEMFKSVATVARQVNNAITVMIKR